MALYSLIFFLSPFQRKSFKYFTLRMLFLLKQDNSQRSMGVGKVEIHEYWALLSPQVAHVRRKTGKHYGKFLMENKR